MEALLNRITIFHYHLLPGGVTNVILLGATAMIRHDPELELLRLVCGREDNTGTIRKALENEISRTNRPEGSLKLEICIEAGIDYRSCGRKMDDAETDSLARKLQDRFGDSFWWIHNYQLGKNPLFTAAIVRTAETQKHRKMILHIHDFPECARFDNLDALFSAGVKNPYPLSSNTAYALINGRDAAILESAGVPADRIHLLNNPVEDDETLLERPPEKMLATLRRDFYRHYSEKFPRVNPDAALLFYPVRTIRRKNVLEAGLIAAISERPVNLVVSLPGVSPQEKGYSDTCERAFKTGLIPGIWGSGTDNDPAVPSYPQMLQLCDMILSSSVQEGFGYLFINSVQLGVPLVARDLDILDGIRDFFPPEHSAFYTGLFVPVDKNDAYKLKELYREKAGRLAAYFSGSALSKIRESIDSLASDGTIDFAFLDTGRQIETLKRVRTSTAFREEIHILNGKLMQAVYTKLDNGRYNPEINTDRFSLKSHAETVINIIDGLNDKYGPDIKQSEMIQQNLLDRFAEPQYMRLLYD